MRIFLYIFIFAWSPIWGQESSVLTLQEYLGYVKMYHPILKQANLVINESEAKLLKARGAIDPKFEVDFDRKRFKDTDYYNKLNAVFKIPTWYGIDIKGSYQNNNGKYLNPESNLPEKGIYSLGVSVSLSRALFFNERMATLQKAKLYQQQAQAKNQLLVNEILYNATLSYFKWLKAYQEKLVYTNALDNVAERYDGVKRSFAMGDKPAIDTTEVRIALNTQHLNLEKANLYYTKTALELSNFLWIKEVPVEVKSSLIPDVQTQVTIDEALGLNDFQEINIDAHPKMQSLDFKRKSLAIEKRLKKSLLFPKINLEYNFLNSNPTSSSYYEIDNYKGGIKVSTPLFFRKEKAALRLAEYKIQSIDFEKKATEVTLKNKFLAIKQEINSLREQIAITDKIIADYETLVKGEERKFSLGESSIFLVNYRQVKLIETELKAILLENKFLKAKGKMFNTMARN